MLGNFVVQRSEKKFSMMAKDQSHEQSNKTLKNEGGPAGLFDNAESLAINLLSKAEVLRIIDEFEQVVHPADKSTAHHEEARHFQLQFKKNVVDLKREISEKGNPFLESSNELIALDSREVMTSEVAKCLQNAKDIGQKEHESYVQNRIVEASVPVTDTIHRQNIFTFQNRPNDKNVPGKSKVGTMKQDCNLITRLLISLQSRTDSNVEEFFKYENQRQPPSLADRGNLRFGTKSNILQCLPGMPEEKRFQAVKLVTCFVFDMAAVIHMVKPTRAITFDEYVPVHLVPFLQAQFSESVTTVHAIWDTYPAQSLKAQTHNQRGVGTYTRLCGKTPIPKDWPSFLKKRKNKIALFALLSESLSKANFDKCLVTTKGEIVLSNQDIDAGLLQPCNHEEADTRILLHLAHASMHGHNKAYVRTVDSDIVILAISFFSQLDLRELWIGFGSGRNYRDIPIHEISRQLGEPRSMALPLFHALSGCDTTSQFFGIGKKTAWSIWEMYPDITETFVALLANPEEFTMESSHLQTLERFTVLMYSKSCGASRVNEARTQLFSHGLHSLDSIPPTPIFPTHQASTSSSSIHLEAVLTVPPTNS